jgi:hypothetical protein
MSLLHFLTSCTLSDRDKEMKTSSVGFPPRERFDVRSFYNDLEPHDSTSSLGNVYGGIRSP